MNEEPYFRDYAELNNVAAAHGLSVEVNDLWKAIRVLRDRLDALEYHCLPLPLDSYTKQ